MKCKFKFYSNMRSIQSLIFSWNFLPYLSVLFTASGSANTPHFRKPGLCYFSNNRVITKQQEENYESRKTIKGKKIKKDTPCGSLIHATAAVATVSVRHLIQNEKQRLLFPEKF